MRDRGFKVSHCMAFSTFGLIVACLSDFRFTLTSSDDIISRLCLPITFTFLQLKGKTKVWMIKVNTDREAKCKVWKGERFRVCKYLYLC